MLPRLALENAHAFLYETIRWPLENEADLGIYGANMGYNKNGAF